MKLLVTAIICLLVMFGQAQTREIAFKSHSGNMVNYDKFTAFFAGDEGTFGLPAYTTSYELDSVIYVSPSLTILVTKEYRRGFREPLDSALLFAHFRDSLRNDPVFSKKHSLDSIRKVLSARKKFTNPIGNVIFVGFDNKKKQKAKKDQPTIDSSQAQLQVAPVFITVNTDDSTPGRDGGFIRTVVVLTLLLSVAGALISWRISQPRLRQA